MSTDLQIPPNATPQQLHDFRPWPMTEGKLASYISQLRAVVDHYDEGGATADGYEALPYIMGAAMYAVFNFFAHHGGATGFQVSRADMDLFRRTRGLDCPFRIIAADRMMYPQYDVESETRVAMESWRPWLAREAKKRLADSSQTAHPNVVAHWEKLTAYDAPTEVKP